jgi:hypothetical protein
MSLWAGQGVRLARPTTAEELVRGVAEEAEIIFRGATGTDFKFRHRTHAGSGSRGAQ